MILRYSARVYLLVALISGACVWAEDVEHLLETEIPWGSIGVQTFNFVFLAGVLIYLLRKPVVEHFQARLKAFKELVDRAETAKKEAQKTHGEISDRLRDLQASADDNVRRARADAAELKRQLMEEAKLLAKKLDEDAKRTVELEIDRAKSALRSELLNSALEASRETLEKSIPSSEQKRLQTEFVDKIQVVGQ